MFKDLSGTKLGLFIFAGSMYIIGAAAAPDVAPHRVAIKNEIKKYDEQIQTMNAEINNIESFIEYTKGYEIAVANKDFRVLLDGLARHENTLHAKIDSLELKTIDLKVKYDDVGDKLITMVKSWYFLFE